MIFDGNVTAVSCTVTHIIIDSTGLIQALAEPRSQPSIPNAPISLTIHVKNEGIGDAPDIYNTYSAGHRARHP